MLFVFFFFFLELTSFYGFTDKGHYKIPNLYLCNYIDYLKSNDHKPVSFFDHNYQVINKDIIWTEKRLGK